MSFITAVRLTATGTAFSRPVHIKQVTGVATAAGLITIRDGGGSGPIILNADVTTGFFALDIPADGIRATGNDCHVTITNITGLTLYVG